MPKTDRGSPNYWRQTVRERGSFQDGKTLSRNGMSGALVGGYPGVSGLCTSPEYWVALGVGYPPAPGQRLVR